MDEESHIDTRRRVATPRWCLNGRGGVTSTRIWATQRTPFVLGSVVTGLSAILLFHRSLTNRRWPLHNPFRSLGGQDTTLRYYAEGAKGAPCDERTYRRYVCMTVCMYLRATVSPPGSA